MEEKLLLLVKLQAIVTLRKVRLLHGFFSRFSNCANGTKLHNAQHLKIIWDNAMIEWNNVPCNLTFRDFLLNFATQGLPILSLEKIFLQN